MVWGTLASALFVGIVLLPGLVWLWTSERRIPRTARPGALAVAEASGIGAAATLVTSFLLFALGSWLDWPFDFGEWLSCPSAFRADLAQHPVGLATVFVAEPILAAIGAGALANWLHRKRPVLDPGSTVLHETLGGDDGKEFSTRFAAVTMKDGRVIEGWVGSYSTDSTERFLSLTAPIYVTAADGTESETRSDEVILNMDNVVDIGIVATKRGTEEAGDSKAQQ